MKSILKPGGGAVQLSVFRAFFRAAAALSGPDSRVLPGRQRLLDKFRELHVWPAGSPDVWKAVMGEMRERELVRVVPGKPSELAPHLTFRAVLAAVAPRRGRKQKRPSRAPGSSRP